MITKKEASAVVRNLIDSSIMIRNHQAIVVRFDGAHAASPVTVNGESTQYQVADFRHDDKEAARKLAEQWEVKCVYVVGAYYRHGEWVTEVVRYRVRTF